MSEQKRITILFWIVLLMLTAAACGGSSEDSPALIGAYPSGVQQSDWVVALPERATIVYHAMIDLEVRSVSKAVDEIIDLAHEHGGYVTTANTWYESRDEHANVAVSVPVYEYDLLYDDILRLGRLQGETLRGELDPPQGYGWDELVMSTITVHLSERPSVRMPAFPDWHAASTFEQAFGVTAAIFRFLFDAAIWLIVVVGPFVLLGWGARKVWLRLRMPHTQTEEEKTSN